MILVGANAPVGVREPPAGPPKLDLDFEIDHFFENSPISVIFGVMEKSLLHKKIAPGNRIGLTNAVLDMS